MVSFSITSCNFQISSVDHSLFTKRSGKDITMILIYVDNLIYIGNNEQVIRLIKHQLKDNFDIKDFELLEIFFGN
jgi:Reverse transcriptase (RNA-dependent DNA polymerase)